MLAALLAATAERHGARRALAWKGGELRWSELAACVNARAGVLHAEGVTRGRAVALLLGNGPHFVVDFLAVAQCGAVAVPLNPGFKTDEVAGCLAGCDVAAVVHEDGAMEVALGATERVAHAATLLPLAALDARAETAHREPHEGDALFAFSSGSTGTPKRIVRTQANLVAEAEHVTAATSLGPDDAILGVVPFHHAHGLGNCVLAALRSGAALVTEPSFDPRRTLATIERERITVFPGVPFLFRLLAEVRSQESPDLSSLRLCFSAGAALPAPVFEAFDKRYGVPVRQLYGCSEAGSLTLNLDPDAAGTAATCGRALGEVTVQIRNEQGAPCDTGVVGEVVVTSPTLGRSDDDHASFRDGRFFSGDLGSLDAAGRLTLHGRTKLFVSTPAGKVDPAEVERCLADHPDVAEVVVLGVPSKGGDELVKVAVVANGTLDDEGQSRLRRELVARAREQLAEFKVPRRVELVDEIPKSPLGKVLRKYLL